MKGLDAKLLLAGEGDLSSQLRAQVKQAGLQDKVQFLGYVAPAELKTLTSRGNHQGLTCWRTKDLVTATRWRTSSLTIYKPAFHGFV